jgi:hypothetical protein
VSHSATFRKSTYFPRLPSFPQKSVSLASGFSDRFRNTIVLPSLLALPRKGVGLFLVFVPSVVQVSFGRVLHARC